MRINFFEEFPDKKNLDKLKLVDFPSTVYIAAKSLDEFKKIRNKIKKKNITVGYWPVLDKKEGYWFSAFSKRKAVKRIIDELRKNKEKVLVLWDMELPMLYKILFLSELSVFLLNRKIIYDFLNKSYNYNKDIVTAEHAFRGRFIDWLFRLFAIRHPDKDKRIYMVYSSNLRGFEKYLEENCKKIGIGVIDVGILGTEKPITAEQLDKDLSLANKNNIEEVTIFRLGGLNNEYLKYIKKYL